MRATTTLTAAIAILFILTPAIVTAQVYVNEGAVSETPVSMGEPGIFDPSVSGHVKVAVYVDDGDVEPLENSTVILFNTHGEYVDHHVTDAAGETEFVADAGTYTIHVDNEKDYLEREIELTAGESAGTQVFVFTYNPSSSGGSVGSEPPCPGIIKIDVLQDTGGLVVMLPDVEVQLVSTGGEVIRTGFTNRFGQATFVVAAGLYNVVCIHYGEIQSQWVFVSCGDTVDGIKFYF